MQRGSERLLAQRRGPVCRGQQSPVRWLLPREEPVLEEGAQEEVAALGGRRGGQDQSRHVGADTHQFGAVPAEPAEVSVGENMRKGATVSKTRRKVAAAVSAVAITAVAAPAAASAKTITLSGSTSVAPLAAKLAKAYVKNHNVKFRLLQ